MNSLPPSRLLISAVMSSILLVATGIRGYSQTVVTNDPPFYGPFNAVFLPDGDGLKKPLGKNDSVLRADSPWSLYAWVKPSDATHTLTLVAGFGDPTDEFSRYLALDGDHVVLWMGKDNSLSGPATLALGKWHFLAATFDGEEFHLHSDGAANRQRQAGLGKRQPRPADGPTLGARGAVASFRRYYRWSHPDSKRSQRR